MRIRIIFASSILALSALGQACSSSDTSSPRPGFGSGNHNAVTGSGDAGTQTGVGAGDAGSTPVDTDAEAPPTAGACNYQDNTATPVNVTSASGSMPQGNGTGAQPLDGEYFLTAITHYGSGGSGDSYKATAYISAGTHQYVISKNGAADERTSVSIEYQPDGSLLWTGKCGTSTVATLRYSVPTETSLIIYDSSTNMASTYTRSAPPDPTP
jgi:hypothetical protein